MPVGELPVTTPASRTSPRRALALLAAIVVIAALLRLYQLDAVSFWYDEGATLLFAAGGFDSWIADNHPPLYYALVHLWLRFGDSEYWLRLSSVIPAVVTVPVVFALGRRLFDTGAGLLAALCIALMAFHISFSQELRMYALLVLLYACTLWALVAAAHDDDAGHWFGYTLAAIVLAYSHGIGIVYVTIVACLFPLVSPRPRQLSSWRPFLVANLVVALCYLPWLLAITQADFRLGNIAWIDAPRWFDLEKTFTSLAFERIPVAGIVAKLSGITLSQEGESLMMFVPVVLLAGVGTWRAYTQNRGRAAATAVLALALPVIVLYALSYLVAPMYLNRVLLPISVGFVLLLGAAVYGSSRVAIWVWCLIGLNLAMFSLNTFYYFRYGSKADFRALSQDLQRQVGPEELILFVEEARVGRTLIDYYDAEGVLADSVRVQVSDLVAGCGAGSGSCIASRMQQILPSRRVWIVYVHDHAVPPAVEAAKRWLEHNVQPIGSTTYRVASVRLVEGLPKPGESL